MTTITTNRAAPIVREALGCNLNAGLWFEPAGVANMTGLDLADVREALIVLVLDGEVELDPELGRVRVS